MRSFPWVLVIWAAFFGAVYAYAGYDPASHPERGTAMRHWLIELAGLAAVFTVLTVLLMPVIIRVNEGQWDWRKVRNAAGAWAIAMAQAVAIVIACFLIHGLVIAVTEGWRGGWPDVPVGGVIGALAGAVVGWPVAFVGAWLRVALGIPNQDAEPIAAPDPARDIGSGSS